MTEDLPPKKEMDDLVALQNWLWKAADIFRGLDNNNELQKVILFLIFYKRINDLFEDTLTEYTQKYSNEEVAYERIEVEFQNNLKHPGNHFITYPIPSLCRWSVFQTETDIHYYPRIILELMSYVTHLLRPLGYLLDNISLDRFQVEVPNFHKSMHMFIFELSQHHIGKKIAPNTFGQAFAHLLNKYAGNKTSRGDIFTTPQEVGWLAVKLLHPTPGSTIYDGACGTGSLLIKAHMFLETQYPTETRKPSHFYGQDISTNMQAIAAMNSILHGYNDILIRRGDTLRESTFFTDDHHMQQFDYAIENPPWHSNVPQDYLQFYPERFKYGIPPKTSTDWAWIQHTVASLNPGGRAAILMPPGILFRGSGTNKANRERDIRKAFVEEDIIEAIVLLPGNLFSYTTIPAILLLLNRDKAINRKNQILLINATNDFRKEKQKNKLTEEGIDVIINAYQRWETQEHFSQVISIEDARATDYNLYPAQFIDVEKDFLISYDTADRFWAEWISAQLIQSGYTTLLQPWDTQLDSKFRVSVDKLGREAKYTIAILSPDYIKALYTEPEWAAALIQDPTEQAKTLLPIRIRECNLPRILGSIAYFDFVGLGEAAARQLLLQAIRPILKQRKLKSEAIHEALFPMSTKQYDFDIAISYASEDSLQAEALAKALSDKNINIFFDNYKLADLWGENLFTKLADIYHNKAQYCIILLSKHYVQKQWASLERQIALMDAFGEDKKNEASIGFGQDQDYIIAIKLDDTTIPELPLTNVLDWATESAEIIANTIANKLGKSLPDTATQLHIPNRITEISEKYEIEMNIPTETIEDQTEGYRLQTTLSITNDTGFLDNEIRQVIWSPTNHAFAITTDGPLLWIFNQQNKSLSFFRVGPYHSVAWSLNSTHLAYGKSDNTVCILDVISGLQTSVYDGHSNYVTSLAWSPDGAYLASGGNDNTIQVWDTATGTCLFTCNKHSSSVTSLAWSPDGTYLASGRSDHTIQIWDATKGALLFTYEGHSNQITSLTWSHNSLMLASASNDRTVRLWDISNGKISAVLKGIASSVNHFSFSCEDQLLALQSNNGSTQLWRTDTWERLEIPSAIASNTEKRGLSFHPQTLSLAIATAIEGEISLNVWELDKAVILTQTASNSHYYTNAKVILVGDATVGKTALGRALTGHPYAPTDSTHGRYVYLLKSETVELSHNQRETREIFLWDLAGQPGYRLIHQLHLNDVALALIVFDTRSETDPFGAIYYWNRALQQAQQLYNIVSPPMKKFLIAARVDRQGVGVSQQRIQELAKDLGFDEYFATSALEGTNIEKLLYALEGAIYWEIFPKLATTDLFQRIKLFLRKQQALGVRLAMIDSLYREFLRSGEALADTDNIYDHFKTCVEWLESQDLIRQLKFGEIVLLQPELLDLYASALLNAVKEEPDGLGIVLEEKVRTGNFYIPRDIRLASGEQEQILLIAMVEDLLRRGIILREPINNEMYLIFPSQSTRENPELSSPEGAAIIFKLQGALVEVYTTLVTKLSQCGIFHKKDIYKNAMTFTTHLGGTYGIHLEMSGEERGKMRLFFKEAGEEARFYFKDFVFNHLQTKLSPQNIQLQYIAACTRCGILIHESLVSQLVQSDIHQMQCPKCLNQISLLSWEDQLTKKPLSLLPEMIFNAEVGRAVSANKFTQHNYMLIQKEIHMSQHTGDNIQVNAHSISNVGGQQNIGKFQDVVANLQAANQTELANALETLTNAVLASKHLSEEEKKEHVEVIEQIGSEASKPKPNKTLLKTLGNGLIATLKIIPDVAKAAAAVLPLLTSTHS